MRASSDAMALCTLALHRVEQIRLGRPNQLIEAWQVRMRRRTAANESRALSYWKSCVLSCITDGLAPRRVSPTAVCRALRLT